MPFFICVFKPFGGGVQSLPPPPFGFGGGVQPSGGENPPSGGVQPSSELTSKLPYEGVFLIIYLLEAESNRRDVVQK